ncbi:MAG TPA: transporter substrate-binding domain-containing protein [Methylomirabilota bacterium]|jgi:polar amino acid transport system substrate-binding protein/glutamate/aspartate transport system substrate-binding protein|nr:transporter substrate-binding domain-containing protein [Methylomirabilota bacterium]
MKRVYSILLAVTVVLALAAPAFAETTLEKIGRTGVLVIGTRTGSPPFGFINKNNEWVGFSIDLVDQAIVPALSKKLGKPIKVEKKESAPATRIPLLQANAVDLIAETMTDTPERRQSVDFSLTFFLTGAQFLVKKGNPIKGIDNIAGKRIAAQQGSTNAKIIREKVPTANLREFPDQPSAFQALVQGQVDAYTNDGIQLAGLKAKAPKPDDWEVVGAFYSREPYGMAMRKGEADFKGVVDEGLKEALRSGKYFELYDKWFGAKGEVPYPLTPEVKEFLLSQVK